MSIRTRSLVFLLTLVLSPSLLWAQTASGTIQGVVKDTTDAVLPGVDVTVKETETGRERTAVTDENGNFRVVSLPPGAYEVTAALSGFKTSVQTGITLALGESLSVNFALEVGELAETIAVVAQVVRVETTSATLGGLVDVQNIRELPLNGRDWMQLVTLQPGTNLAMGQSTGDGNRAQRGLGQAVSISGGRATENAFQIDGLTVNDYANAGPGSALQVNLGVDAIREFKVLTNSYSAEYGRGSGGVVTAVTKSGTNTLHGSAFYFHRNSALDAAAFRDPGEPPPFRRHQFGASAGGPIVQNRTFYFANYEGLREHLSTTQIPLTLTAAAKAGNLTTGTVTVDPRVKPYLELLPDPNGKISGDTGEYIFESGRTGHEHYFTGKIDHSFSPSLNLSGTYMIDDAEVFRKASLNQVDIGAPSRRQNAAINVQQTFTPTLLNTLRFGVSRTYAANEVELRTTNPILEDPAYGFIPGRNVGTFNVNVTGLSIPSGIGSADGNVFGYTAPQIANDLTWLRGAHSLRIGFGIENIRSNVDAKQGANGGWQFGGLADFLQARPNQFQGQLPGSDTQRGLRTTIYSAYINDDFRATDRLTLNLGVRYEMNTVISEHHGRIAVLRDLRDATPHLGDPMYDNPTLKNFAPRIGIAWDPFGDGRTAVRSGFGVFDVVPLPYLLTNRATRAAPFFTEAVRANPPPETFPNNIVPFLNANPSLRQAFVDPDPARAYRMQWNFNVQRELISNVVATAGYVGSAARHMPQSVEDIDQVPPELVTVSDDGHYLFPTTGTIPRINPNWGRIAATLWRGVSNYHALQVNVAKRMANRWSLQGNYTWSKSIDNGTATFSDAEYGNTAGSPWPFDPKLNRGRSDFDLAHVFSLHFRWDVPAPAGGVAKAIFGGWEMAGIVSASSGGVFSVKQNADRARTGNSRTGQGTGAQRPDWSPDAPGCNNSPTTGNPDDFVNVNCFTFPALGVLGNLGRNTFRVPNVKTVDFSLFKNIPFASAGSAQLRIEVFNLLNEVNYQPSLTVVFNNSGGVQPRPGRLEQLGTARQVQLGLKFLW
jgi:hypothetical protein